MRSKLRVFLCLALSALSLSAMAAMPQAGLWSVSGEINGQPGRGIQIDRQGGRTVILSYFGYRPDGSALFLQAAGPLQNGKTLSATLLEYKDGQPLGGTPHNATEAASHGTVTVEFDTPTSGSITLPGEQKAPFARYTYEDLKRRLNNTFAVSTFWPSVRGYGLRKDATLIVTAKDGQLTMDHSSIMNALNPTMVKRCIFQGDLIPSGAGFRSAGSVSCTPADAEFRYEVLDLRVDEYGMLTARVDVTNSGRFTGSMVEGSTETMYITGHCLGAVKKAGTSEYESQCTAEALGLRAEDFPLND
ncbi:MAG: hypothetical protein LBE61_13435 [Burkholderiaceae bacterium]|jgi:hypothetical protein|nr:hypothetical protein [Burkholderiaceae bacterium]